MFAAEPDALDVDTVGEIPDLFLCVDRVRIITAVGSICSELLSSSRPGHSQGLFYGDLSRTYCIIPALLNMISTPPHESRCFTMASTSVSLETSHLMVSSRGGLGRIEWTFENAFSRAGSDMSAMRTAAPSRAKRIVVSSPIPLHQKTVTYIISRNKICWDAFDV